MGFVLQSGVHPARTKAEGICWLFANKSSCCFWPELPGRTTFRILSMAVKTACGRPVLTVPGRPVLSAHQENGAISPGTLCTPRHAAASSRRKGPLRRAFRRQSASLHPPFQRGGEAQPQGQATRALAAAPPSAACRSRDAWLRENGFCHPFPPNGGERAICPVIISGSSPVLMDSLLRLSADK